MDLDGVGFWTVTLQHLWYILRPRGPFLQVYQPGLLLVQIWYAKKNLARLTEPPRER